MSDKKRRPRHSLRVIEGGVPGVKAEADRKSPSVDVETLRERDQQDLEIQKQTQKQGGLADRALRDYQRKIPMQDRIQMARNMDALIRHYRIKKSDLDYKRDGLGEDQFGVMLSRCRLSANSAKNKQLNAHAPKWIQIIDYIHRHLVSRGLSVSRQQLFDRLTQGSCFHPSKQRLDIADKVDQLLTGTAGELASQFNLLSHYGKSAELRVDHYEKQGRFLEGNHWFAGFHESVFNSTLAELFGYEINWEEIANKACSDLSPAEWYMIEGQLPCKELFWPFSHMIKTLHPEASNPNEQVTDDWGTIVGDIFGTRSEVDEANQQRLQFGMSVHEYFDLRADKVTANLAGKKLVDLVDEEWNHIEVTKDIVGSEYFRSLHMQLCKWQGYTDPARSIITYAHDPGLPLSSLAMYPHALIGRYDYSMPYEPVSPILNPEDPYWASEIASGFDAEEVLGIIHGGECDDDYPGSSWCFLILLPDIQNHCMRPYLYHGLEAYSIWPIDEKMLRDEDNFWSSILPPFPAGGPAILKSLLDILIEDIIRIKRELTQTAKQVAAADPYLKWESSRHGKMDELLNSLWHE